MESPGWFWLIVLRELLNATTRLFGILMKTKPLEGFPILRLFLDALDAMAIDSHPVTVAPKLLDLIDRFEYRCPGVWDAVLRARNTRDLRDRDCLGTAPETTDDE